MTEKYDIRNKLNNLTGKEWLKLTKSFWMSEKCVDDKDALKHPAPFLVKDTMKLISLFTKEKMRVLDPFVGSGTTLLASAKLKRYGIGIDLNKEYKELTSYRLNKSKFKINKDFQYILGDAKKEIKKIKSVDYIITSPPYHNILRNKGGGIRSENNTGHRTGARTGIEYYTEFENDLGNKNSYPEFLNSLESIMEECYQKLNNGKYLTIVISDFTVNKKEICVQADIVNSMQKIGFNFVGTTVLLQNTKPLYPFGYPYAYKINHHHQNMIHFRKDIKI